MTSSPYVTLNLHPSTGRDRLGQKEIVERISGDICSGRLRPGVRLPPVRSLQQQLGVGKNTVQGAYDELAARGLVESRERRGVFVAAREPEHAVDSVRRARPVRLLPALTGPPHRSEPGRVPLDMVFVDPKLLPYEQLSNCARSVLSSPGLQTFYDSQGNPGLRAAIAERLNKRGMDVNPDDVIVTNGSQQALDLVARSLQRKVLATENPVYSFAKQLFFSLGCQLVPLTLDPFVPIDMDEWEKAIAQSRPSLVYVIPNFQNPTGYSYSTNELERLLELSDRYDFAILEDDWGSDMLSGGEFRPTLRALGGPNVLYVNSFTKKLLPTLRLGYVVASGDAKKSLLSAKRLCSLGSPWLMEATLCEFMDRGYYDRHLAKLNDELDARYAACIQLLRETLPEGVHFSLPGGGPTLWLNFPWDVSVPSLRQRLAAHGIDVQATDGHFYGRPHLNGFRMTFAYLDTPTLAQAVRVLAEEITQLVHEDS